MATVPIDQDNTGEKIFPKLDADDDEIPVTEIESLCMNCHENGITRLMLTRVPHFKELIISSFSCDACGHEEREAQFGGKYQDQGSRINLEVKTIEDLNRQVIKSEFGIFKIPELDFEQEPNKKGEISTVEGMIDAVKNGLEAYQPVRKIHDPQLAEKIDAFIEKLSGLKTVNKPFHFIIEDPTGNSFIENPIAPKKDEALKVTHFKRTSKQNELIGLEADENGDEEEENDPDLDLTKEVNTFRDNCPHCGAICETNMKLVDIPFFKSTIVMATNCDACGARDNEVKAGSGIEPKGRRLTLKLTDPSDLNRDVLKSDTCGFKIPELELELVEGTLGGKFTTIEGLLSNIRDQLGEQNPFMGDSAQDDTRKKIDTLLAKLDEVIAGKMLNITVILDDPAGNSYLQNVYAPEDDPEMKVEEYERSYEQNEILGLNDMKTENYDQQEAEPNLEEGLQQEAELQQEEKS